jgi:hypothetical protein
LPRIQIGSFLVTSEMITAYIYCNWKSYATYFNTYGSLSWVTSRLVINLVYRSFGLCRHKCGVLLIFHACSLHFIICKFVFIYSYLFFSVHPPPYFCIISLTHGLAPLLQTTVALKHQPICINVVFSNIHPAPDTAPLSKAPPSTVRPLTLWRLKFMYSTYKNSLRNAQATLNYSVTMSRQWRQCR